MWIISLCLQVDEHYYGVVDNVDVMVFTHNPSTYGIIVITAVLIGWDGKLVLQDGWSVAWQQRICYQLQLKALLTMLMTSTNSSVL